MWQWDKVIRINAPGMLTLVVQIVSFSDWGDPFLVSKSVRQYSVPFCRERTMRIPLADLRSDPNPTGIFSWQFARKAPESFKRTKLGLKSVDCALHSLQDREYHIWY
jgi:hypothetical protein